MKKILYVVLGLVVVVVGAAVIVPSLVDLNDYKPQIVAKVKEATGRDLVIGGPIKLSILPSPRLAVSDVRFANMPGARAPDMAQVKSLRVSVALVPLISGKIDVTQVTLVEPRIVLETLRDGTSNWNFTAASAAAGDKSPKGEGATGGGAPSSVSVRDLSIEKGNVVWRDDRTGQNVELSEVDARLRADTLQGPMEGNVSFKARGVPVSVEGKLAGSLNDPSIPVYVLAKTTGGQIRIDGKLAGMKAAPELSGAFSASGDNLAALVEAFAVAAGQPAPTLPPSLGQKFSVDASLAASQQRLALSNIRLGLGNDTGTGSVQVQSGPPLRADVKMAFPKLDFDKLLSGATPAPVPGTAPAAKNGGATKPAATDAAAMGLPKDVEGSIDLSVGTIVYKGKTAQQVVVKGDLSKGVLTIANIGGQFPGNTTVSAAGTVDASKAQPTGSGKVEIRSDRLRDLLAWLDVDVPKISPDRLNSLNFTGQIAATPQGAVQIANAVLQIDSTTARGSVTVQPSPKLAVVADLDVDTLNLDPYLPQESGPKKDGGAKQGAAKGSTGLPVDATVKLRVAHLTYSGNLIQGVKVDVTVTPDKLTFRQSRVADLAGAAAVWSGTVASYAQSPSVDLDVDVKTQDVDRVLRLAGIAPPLKDKRIGALSASGHIAGRPTDLTFKGFAVEALDSTVLLTGRFSEGAQGPLFNFSRLELQTANADRLLALAGAAAPGGRRLGAVSVTGSAQGSLDQATVNLDARVQSAAIGVDGTIAGLRGSPTLALTLTVSHPDFAGFMKLLSPTYGGGTGVGPVKLQARIDGSPARELKITNLRGNLGQAPISGTITANMAGAVPDVVANLETGELLLDRILPMGQRAELQRHDRRYPHNVIPVSGGDRQVAQAQRGGSRYSRTPIDVSALHAVNARIDLKSQALVMAPWRVDGAVAQIALKNGIVNVTRVSGRAFNGDFSLTGTLDASRLPAKMNATLNVTSLDMGALSRALVRKERFDGKVSFDASLTSAGSSEADLVDALNGNAKVNGTIKVNASAKEQMSGMLLGKGAKQLDKLFGKFTGQKDVDLGGADINSAIKVALDRFANREGPVSGSFAVRNGVITSSDLRVTGDRAHTETTLTASLPAWTLDARTKVFLDENPQQPYLFVTNKGALNDPNTSIDKNTAYRGSGSQSGTQQPSTQQPSTQQPSTQQPSQESTPSKKNKSSPLDFLKKLR